MQRKINMQITLEHLEEAAGEFFPAFGMALAEWAGVERALCYWFLGITGMKQGMGRALFYSPRSFNARADLLKAAIEHASRQNEDELEFIRVALKKALT